MKKILPFLLVLCMCLSITTLFVGADAPQKYTIDFSASDNLGWAPNAEFSIVEASAKLTYQEKSFGLYTWGKDNNKGYTPQNILDSHYHMYFKSNKDGSITTDFHYMVVEYSAKTSYADAVKIQILHGANFHILGALTVDSVSRKDGTRARTQAVDVDQKITRDPNSGGTGEASLATTTRLLNREVAMSFTEDTTADADYRIYSISFFNNQATADAYAAGELSDKDFRSGYTIDYSNHDVLSRYVDERDSFRYGEDAVELIYEDHEEHTYPNINVTQYDRPWWMGNENWQSWANVEDSWYHWIMQKNKGDLFSTKLRYMVIEYSIVTSYEGEIKIGMINGGTVHVAGAQIVGTVAAKDGTLSRTDPVDISDANGTKFNFIPRLSANQMVNVFFTGDNTTDAVYKIHNVYFYENESDALDENMKMLVANALRIVGVQRSAASYTAGEGEASYTAQSLRFVAALQMSEELLGKFDKVGFLIQIRENGKDSYLVKEGSVVYTSITANEKTVTATEYDANYLVALSVNNVPIGSSFVLTITPYLTDANGTKWTGNEAFATVLENGSYENEN